MTFYWQLLESNKCFTAQPILWGNSCNTLKKYVLKRKKKMQKQYSLKLEHIYFLKKQFHFVYFYLRETVLLLEI